MKKRLLYVFGLIVIGSLALTAAPAAADSVGPYYATPSWDQTLPPGTRFIVLSNMGSAAVLDRETGLVWEKVPSASVFNWFDASFHCLNLNTGGRTGWRLATIQELLSIVDRSAVNPALPNGHPFTVQSSVYWSATALANNTALAWLVDFSDGSVVAFFKSDVNFLAWCVRGGPGVNAQ